MPTPRAVVPKPPPEDSGSKHRDVTQGSTVGVLSNVGMHEPSIQSLVQQLETHQGLLLEADRRIEALERHVRSGDRSELTSVDEQESPPRKARKSVTYESWSYQLQNSVWEAPLLVGSGTTDFATNVTILVAFLMNASMQVLFCSVAVVCFTDEKFPEVSDIEKWRYSVAHDVAWADPSSGESLVSMVCKGDSSLSVATTQRDLVKEIAQYTDSLLLPFDGFGVPQGALLSMLAIIMWFLVVMVENLDAFSFMSGVFMVFAKGRRKGLRRTTVRVHGDELEFGALSVLHVAGMCVTVCVRLVVAAILLYVGVWWLQNTTSLEDLVLNAASLSFIMQFDELVFSTMVTLRGRTRLRQLRPLPLPRAQKTLLLCVRPIVVSVVLAILVCALTPSLRDNVRTMEDLQQYLCGGRQNFVFAVMPSTGWTMTLDTDDDNRTVGTFGRLALEAAVWNESAVAQDLYFDIPSATLFTKLRTLTSIDNLCNDDAFPRTPTRLLLSYQLGFEESWSCSDVPFHLCSDIENSLLRQQCPVRCGCREPRSPLYLTMSWMGCPETCSRTEEYILMSSQIPCSVETAAEMRAKETWPMWVDSYTSVQSEWGRNMSLAAQAFLQTGCEFVRSNVHLCYDSFNISSMGVWCPVECGCREPRSANPGAAEVQCPPQCDAWVSRYETQLALLRCEDRDASNFSQHEGLSFLNQHFETFQRTFTEDLRDNFTLVLGARGCDFLSAERHLCGSPYFLKAVCPVVCGCVDEPGGVGCPLSCAP